MLDTTVALNAVAQQANSNQLTETEVKLILQTTRGVTFAGITTVTDVKLAAKNKAVEIKKVTVAGVQLFNNVKDFNNVYKAAVKRSAEKLGISAKTDIEDFKVSDTWFHHTDCFSICKHNVKEEYYLYAIYNTSKSVYVMDGQIVDKQTVASYMTAGAAEELLNPKPFTHNVTNDVAHDVIVRTVKLSNVVGFTANKQSVTV